MTRRKRGLQPGPRASPETGSSKVFESALLSIAQKRILEAAAGEFPDLWVTRSEVVAAIRDLNHWGYHRAYRACIRGSRTSDRAGRLSVNRGRFFLRSVPATVQFEIPMSRWLWLIVEEQRLLAPLQPKMKTGWDMIGLLGAMLNPDSRARAEYRERVIQIPRESLEGGDRSYVEMQEEVARMEREYATGRVPKRKRPGREGSEKVPE